MDRIGSILKKINLKAGYKTQVPLKDLTTFQVGGPADYMVSPSSLEEVRSLHRTLHDEGIPHFTIGKGANLLVSDRGIRGVVISTENLTKITREADLVRIGGGLDVSQAIEWCAAQGLSSLEFLYGMPSSIGGAVFMNARCYGGEISQVFEGATVAMDNGDLQDIHFNPVEWEYKKSPFQALEGLILEAWFKTTVKPEPEIRQVMEKNLGDRTAKGHFKAPCAGSVFKNNHAFGEPSGVLIDRCGLKGLSLGGAQVSPWHGNIIINTGNATAQEIRDLILQVRDKVQAQLGFLLEEEVIYAGQW